MFLNNFRSGIKRKAPFREILSFVAFQPEDALATNPRLYEITSKRLDRYSRKARDEEKQWKLPYLKRPRRYTLIRGYSLFANAFRNYEFEPEGLRICLEAVIHP